MIAKPSIFREYDIRGVVDADFDAEFAFALGVAYSKLLALHHDELSNFRQAVAVGRDCRLSGEKLSVALVEGLRSAGTNVIVTGMGPTPQLYFSVFNLNLMGGIQVTGSHNPADQNGFKIMLGRGTMSGSGIQQLRGFVESRASLAVTPNGEGSYEVFAASEAYLNDLVEKSKAFVDRSRKLRVVVDGGNGVGGMIGPELLRQLGCDVIELYTEPDGRFPNHHPDPTVLENIEELRRRVVAERAHVGIAWDGDADRIGVVDENGEVIFGDILLLLYAREMLKEIRQPIVIGDVKCSEVLFSELARLGAQPVMWKTGHSLIKGKLKELNAHLAGEMSGHMFFSHRYYGFDDAIHASARLIELLSHSSKSLSELISQFPKMVSTPELRIDCPEHIKFMVAERAQQSFNEFQCSTLDGVRITFPHGWGLVRASNTQPALVMRFEADSESHLKEYQTLVTQRIDVIINQLSG